MCRSLIQTSIVLFLRCLSAVYLYSRLRSSANELHGKVTDGALLYVRMKQDACLPLQILFQLSTKSCFGFNAFPWKHIKEISGNLPNHCALICLVLVIARLWLPIGTILANLQALFTGLILRSLGHNETQWMIISRTFIANSHIFI